MKLYPTPTRSDARHEQRGVAADLRAWREDRRADARKRAAKAEKAYRKARSKAIKQGLVGAGRVPRRLAVEPPAPLVEVPEVGSYVNGGRVITANRATRRAYGQRGKPARPRLRERRSRRLDRVAARVLHSMHKSPDEHTPEQVEAAVASALRWAR